MNIVKKNKLKLATLTNYRNKILETIYPSSCFAHKKNILKILNRLIWDRSLEINSKLTRHSNGKPST